MIEKISCFFKYCTKIPLYFYCSSRKIYYRICLFNRFRSAGVGRTWENVTVIRLVLSIGKGIQMAKILLADDAAFMRMTIKNALSKAGYTDVYEAADGLQAVDQYNEINPDLVFMDITMPNMDGLEALKTIKSQHPDAKVIMCSAMGQESMVIDAVKSGAKDFIVKPFKPDRILKAVKDMGL